MCKEACRLSKTSCEVLRSLKCWSQLKWWLGCSAILEWKFKSHPLVPKMEEQHSKHSLDAERSFNLSESRILVSENDFRIYIFYMEYVFTNSFHKRLLYNKSKLDFFQYTSNMHKAAPYWVSFVLGLSLIDMHEFHWLIRTRLYTWQLFHRIEWSQLYFLADLFVCG